MIRALLLVLVCVAIGAESAFTWTQVVSGLDRPVGIKHAGDGSGRLFILEQHLGRVRIFNTTTGQLLATPFLNLKDHESVSTGGEGGLLGIAFHPNFTQNGLFFVSYTRADRTSVVARYRVSTGNPNVADVSSRFIIITVAQPFENHNGGDLEFGFDNLLYYSLGDGGSAGDPFRNGQNRNTLLGKILRIDINAPAAGKNYTVPSTNVLGNENFVWGLRNPWRFSFDRLTGDLWIGDVGQGSAEEIDFKKANSSKLFTSNGENYGWNTREGFAPYSGGAPANGQLTDPVTAYSHSGGRCSVTGGYVYRGFDVPELYGFYIYGDYCSGDMYKFKSGQSSALASVPFGLTTFGEDEKGGLYYCLLGGQCFKLTSSDPPSAPKLTATLQLADLNGSPIRVGDRVNISITITNVGNASQPNNPEREFNLTFPNAYLDSRLRGASTGTFSRNRKKSFFWWNGSLAPGRSSVVWVVAVAKRAGRFCLSGTTAFDEHRIGSNTGTESLTGTLCYDILPKLA